MTDRFERFSIDDGGRRDRPSPAEYADDPGTQRRCQRCAGRPEIAAETCIGGVPHEWAEVPVCPDCGGVGGDPSELEECPTCCGDGVLWDDGELIF